ncbi:MAG: glycine cleavage system protein H [Victivallaceae bacterium]|nr:glycine cleavage system protein GcvH [Victivallaceae bacterium]
MKYFSEDHEWVEIDGDEATIGISEYAVNLMGEIIRVELPSEDEDFIVGDMLGTLETERDTTDIYSPISGTISAVNEVLDDDPVLINDSPEDKGWICKMVNFDTAELDDMMNEAAYARYLRELNP